MTTIITNQFIHNSLIYIITAKVHGFLRLSCPNNKEIVNLLENGVKGKKEKDGYAEVKTAAILA